MGYNTLSACGSIWAEHTVRVSARVEGNRVQVLVDQGKYSHSFIGGCFGRYPSGARVWGWSCPCNCQHLIWSMNYPNRKGSLYTGGHWVVIEDVGVEVTGISTLRAQHIWEGGRECLTKLEGNSRFKVSGHIIIWFRVDTAHTEPSIIHPRFDSGSYFCVPVSADSSCCSCERCSWSQSLC